MLAPSANQSPTARMRRLPARRSGRGRGTDHRVVGAATIAGAWFFELVIKLSPCPLCLEQRWPYYIGIPLALLVAIAAWRGAARARHRRPAGARGLMLWGVYLGVFHAGIEWKWWLGPQECSGAPQLGGRAIC
jgi:disulfide bond formation protein DsbB